MAVHSFTGVTGVVTVSGTGHSNIAGWVSGDFTLAVATGKYIELGGNTATANTRGLRSCSGTLKGAYGIKDSTLEDWLDDNLEFTIKFEATTGGRLYTMTGCVLTDLAVEGMEAGSENALMMNASFEGLNWTATTP